MLGDKEPDDDETIDFSQLATSEQAGRACLRIRSGGQLIGRDPPGPGCPRPLNRFQNAECLPTKKQPVHAVRLQDENMYTALPVKVKGGARAESSSSFAAALICSLDMRPTKQTAAWFSG